jgi:hypothetical protein
MSRVCPAGDSGPVFPRGRYEMAVGRLARWNSNVTKHDPVVPDPAASKGTADSPGAMLYPGCLARTARRRAEGAQPATLTVQVSGSPRCQIGLDHGIGRPTVRVID